MSQGVHWILTIPQHCFTPYLPPGVTWIKGQLEIGETTGYVHWQIVVTFGKKKTVRQCRDIFGPYNCELTRSRAAREYVWKDATAVVGTRFELGQLPVRRNVKRDWDRIWESAIVGDLESIPTSVRVQSYRTLRTIAADYAVPVGIEREVKVFWGRTGSGKSRLAWSEAGMDAYPKDPRTKFWCGYRNQKNVVIDEFRGGIDIGHLLRWLDRYPVIVEVKGSSTVLTAERIWITSNLSPDEWYPDLDEPTKDALRRRLKVTHFL